MLTGETAMEKLTAVGQRVIQEANKAPSRSNAISKSNERSNAGALGTPESEQCPSCGTVELAKWLLRRRDDGSDVAFLCPDGWHKVRQAMELQKRLSTSSGLPDEAYRLSLQDIINRGEGSRQMASAATSLANREFGMLTVHGGPGNGKTLMLQILVAEFLRQGESAIYMRTSRLLDHLADGFKDESYRTSERYRRIVSCTFLGLDEIDKVSSNGWARGVVFDIVDDRYIAGRQLKQFTAFTMNQDPDTLPDYLYSRLRWNQREPDGFKIIHNVDGDARETGL